MVNEDSLYQKADNLKHLDIISLSDPHLSDPDHEEPQAQLDVKTLISKPKKKKTGKGGGVEAYISSAVPFHRRVDLKEDEIECKLFGSKCYFLDQRAFSWWICRPPNSSKHICSYKF